MRRSPASHRQVQSSIWRYPGWVLLSGLGLLWLLDYAARGHVKYLFLGLKHFDGLFLAYVLLTISAGFAPTLLSALMRFLAHLDSAVLPASNSAKVMAILLGLLWAGAIAMVMQGHQNDNLRTAAIAEMLRVPVWVLLAWVCYRWVDTTSKPSRALAGGFILAAALIGGLAFINHGDKGQMLLFGLVSVLLVAGWAGHQGTAFGPKQASLMSLPLAMAGIAAVFWLLSNIIPIWSETARWRVDAVKEHFSTRLTFLAQIAWFIRNTPETGYGLTHTPWCGHLGSLGGRCDGVPLESHSDFAGVIGMIGVWGPFVALVIWLLSMLWLLAMLFPSSPPAAAGAGRDLKLFTRWVLSMFVVSTLTSSSSPRSDRWASFP